MELTREDLDMVLDMFTILTKAASVHGVSAVEITFNGESGDSITVGFGENGEPAILGIGYENPPTPLTPYWWPYAPYTVYNECNTNTASYIHRRPLEGEVT